MMARIMKGLATPQPEPIGAPSGMIATQPISSSRFAATRVVGAIDHHLEPVLDQRLGGFAASRAMSG